MKLALVLVLSLAGCGMPGSTQAELDASNEAEDARRNALASATPTLEPRSWWPGHRLTKGQTVRVRIVIDGSCRTYRSSDKTRSVRKCPSASSGVDPRVKDLQALPEWWSHATRGLSSIVLVGESQDLTALVHAYDSPGDYYGLRDRESTDFDVWTRECNPSNPSECYPLRPSLFRMAVLHEIAHGWCCYGEGGLNGHWPCAQGTEIMCAPPEGQRFETVCADQSCSDVIVPLVFSDRELREIGLLP
jgi:hypothetical protein